MKHNVTTKVLRAVMGVLPFCFFTFMPLSATAGDLDITDGAWSITMSSSKTLIYAQSGTTLLKGVYVKVLNGSETELLSKDYPTVTLSKESVSDVFGAGTKYTYTYSGLSGKENIEQSFYIYPDLNYLLVDAKIVATNGVAKTHYIAPIVSTTTNSFLPSSGENVIYDMPHDNDNWVGYSAQPWSIGQLNTSCEVSGVYDVQSRQGLIVGSIEHDNWKSGISITPNGQNRIRNFTVAAGVVSERTNDIWKDRPSVSKHGSISGVSVASPRYFLGYYSDWRTGLEDLGEATAKLCPKLPWDGGTIFAWQSWGGMAEHVNYEGAINVSDFFHEQLEPKNFHNENGVCYIVLDSFWDNMSEDQLRAFAKHCKENGQRPGIYHTPFSYWGSVSDAERNRPYDGSPYTWADICIRANGEIRKISSLALDPTHPGTIEYNRQRFQKFKDWGFEYVKLDFINNGTLEADSYYADGITTGMQAYTYGMNKVIEQCDGMFIDLSIAPIFPAKGHARRISCDSWGELDNSMYSLNSINLGWWLDRVYQYNDPDHLVLSRAEDEGAARIRYTCGAMTGTVLLGDNYSLEGSYLGKQSERDLALKIATNADVNVVAWLGRSFRPVEGDLANSFSRWGQYSYGVDNEFVLDTDKACYYVVFNYNTSETLAKTEAFSRLGVGYSDVKNITELWTGQQASFSANGISVSVPARDVRIYRLEKASWNTGIGTVKVADTNDVQINYSLGSLRVEAPKAFSHISLYGVDGQAVASAKYAGATHAQIPTRGLSTGVFIAKVDFVNGNSATQKIWIKK